MDGGWGWGGPIAGIVFFCAASGRAKLTVRTVQTSQVEAFVRWEIGRLGW